MKRSHASGLVEYFQFAFARTWAQPIWKLLHKLSTLGMNVSGGAEVTTSGELWVLRRLANRDPEQKKVIFDVGAHSGEYALEAVKVFNGRALAVYSFEPSQKAFSDLSEAISDTQQIKAVPVGLSDAPGSAQFFSEQDGSQLGSLYSRQFDYHGLKTHARENITLDTVDLYCQREKIERIDLLKLDVEGHELSVIRGAKRMIGEHRIGAIQFEFGYGNLNSRTTLRDFFDELGPRYSISRILKNGLSPIVQYHEIHEQYMTTNYLAELQTDR